MNPLLTVLRSIHLLLNSLVPPLAIFYLFSFSGVRTGTATPWLVVDAAIFIIFVMCFVSLTQYFYPLRLTGADGAIYVTGNTLIGLAIYLLTSRGDLLRSFYIVFYSYLIALLIAIALFLAHSFIRKLFPVPWWGYALFIIGIPLAALYVYSLRAPFVSHLTHLPRFSQIITAFIFAGNIFSTTLHLYRNTMVGDLYKNRQPERDEVWKQWTVPVTTAIVLSALATLIAAVWQKV
ncbi:MAG TPA: hypothetical protein VJA27_03720 [Patescibacteria group bacterium]|nr:hypothetical protein [Patescibacteria group bacterium]